MIFSNFVPEYLTTVHNLYGNVIWGENPERLARKKIMIVIKEPVLYVLSMFSFLLVEASDIKLAGQRGAIFFNMWVHMLLVWHSVIHLLLTFIYRQLLYPGHSGLKYFDKASIYVHQKIL